MSVVGRHLLVILRRLFRLAELLVRLAQLVKRVRPALGARAKGRKALDRPLRLAELVQIQIAEQAAAEIPIVLLLVARERLGLAFVNAFQQSNRLVAFAAAEF